MVQPSNNLAITLDEETHTYHRLGRKVPGVTRIIEMIDELDGIPREMLARAAQFGRHVHKACHLWNHNSLDLDALDPALKPYLMGWASFLMISRATVLESEALVYHPTLDYAGTLDAIIRWPEVSPLPILLDIKSSAAMPRSVGPQTAMYREAWMAERPHYKLAAIRYCVHLIGDSKYRLVKLSGREDWQVAVSCLNVYRWNERA